MKISHQPALSVLPGCSSAGEDSLFLLSLAWRMLASAAATPAEFNRSFATGCNENFIVFSVSVLLKQR